jgi:hypothetical protein
MLPENIGDVDDDNWSPQSGSCVRHDVDDDITSLDLSNMGLIGKCVYRDLRIRSH